MAIEHLYLQPPSISANLSSRIQKNLAFHKSKDEPSVKQALNPYDPITNPSGIINLGVAESTLMHIEVTSYLSYSIPVFSTDLSYCSSPTGSPQLKRTLAKFINTHFHPRQVVNHTDLLISSGATSVTDMLAWSICETGDTVLVPSPRYVGFEKDFGLRAGVHTSPVDFGGRWNEMFNGTDIKPYEDALRKAKSKVKALVICNPHNPTGRCYTAETLQTLAAWCRRRGLQFVSDEVYATSVHSPDKRGFVSTLAVSEDVKVIYGMSKDFCSNGLRVGVLITRDPGLLEAIASVCRFNWSSSLAERAWCKMLEAGQEHLEGFVMMNCSRLRYRYKVTTKVLKDAGIPYVEGATAGFFVWVDMRSVLRVGIIDEKILMERLCSGNGGGVYVGAADKFYMEQPGWCRIIFSGEEKAWREGLRRFVNIIKGVAEEIIK